MSAADLWRPADGYEQPECVNCGLRHPAYPPCGHYNPAEHTAATRALENLAAMGVDASTPALRRIETDRMLECSKCGDPAHPESGLRYRPCERLGCVGTYR